ncbi:nitronate monooxygenase family protein [Diplocloster hominis]|uniref:NAD(P)H-dependent flavin oxidoreductase n=1 Tax=Diplocloster hominis TaxID=3079010 RepID=UPI0031BBAC7D
MNKELKFGNRKATVPVIQGGMGVGVSLSGLAGAVAKAGGVGIISAAQIGFRDPDFDKDPAAANIRAIHDEIKKARQIAPEGIIGVNIMVATKPYASYVKAAADAGADLIISGAGLPLALPALVKGSGTSIAPIVSSAKSASVICKMWDRKDHRAPDMVIIEGPKAGGHLGFCRDQLQRIDTLDYDTEIKNILSVIREYEIKYQQPIPVAVAGGIYTRSDMDHARSLGADAVQMATRFVTTHECDAHPSYKQAYLNASEDDIIIVDSPVGMPGRAIHNRFVDEAALDLHRPTRCHKCLEHCDPAHIPYCITDALIRAVQGDIDHGLLFCGTNAARADRIEHVSDIMQEFCL